MLNRKERISISIDPLLLKKIDRKARKEGRSRSNYIESIMVKEIGEKFTVRGRYMDEPQTESSRRSIHASYSKVPERTQMSTGDKRASS